MLRTIKKVILQDPIVLAAPMQTRFENLPFTKTLVSSQDFSLDGVQKAALAVLIVPTSIGFVSSLFSTNWTLAAITGFLLLLCAFIVWIIRLRSRMSWKVTWYSNMVEVEDGRYGRPETWREPISTFTGLIRDSGLIRRGGKYTPSQGVFGLLLAHPDPFKSILLHAAYDPIDDDIVAYYEGQLGKKLLGG